MPAGCGWALQTPSARTETHTHEKKRIVSLCQLNKKEKRNHRNADHKMRNAEHKPVKEKEKKGKQKPISRRLRHRPAAALQAASARRPPLQTLRVPPLATRLSPLLALALPSLLCGLPPPVPPCAAPCGCCPTWKKSRQSPVGDLVRRHCPRILPRLSPQTPLDAPAVARSGANDEPKEEKKPPPPPVKCVSGREKKEKK